jgi:catechol 2,3-dioxygenase-like lactoylglutathione lyase family enzyme
VDAYLFRVILPVSDLEAGVRFYSAILGRPGERVSVERHYFDCGGPILALVDPAADRLQFRANLLHVYIAVENLEAAMGRCRAAGVESFQERGQEPGIADRPWGERSFYLRDPFGNPLCFVESATQFTGGRFIP